MTVPGVERRSKGLWFFGGVAAAGIIAGGTYLLVGLNGAPDVVVSPVTRGEVVTHVVASGVVEPSRKEDVSSRVAGVLEVFDLKEGQQVKQGQVIGRVNRTPFAAALADATSRQLAQDAQLAQLERRNALADGAAAPRLAAAEQKLDLARSQLADRKSALQRAVSEATFGVQRAKLALQKQPVSEQLQAELDHAQQVLRDAQADLERLAAPDHPARLQVALAESDLKAARLDVEAGAVLPQELEAARSAAAAAAQAVQKAREDLDNTEIKAPFDGVVLQVYTKQGAGVTPGTPVITLAAFDTAKVAASVDEADVARLVIGNAATVTSPAIPTFTFQGKVTAVMPRATKDTSNSTVIRTEVEFQNTGGRMRDGMSADVVMDADRRTDVLRVPLTALRGKETDRYVFVLQGDHVRRQAVTPGVTDGQWAEIAAGLQPDERVVTGPESAVKSLEDGQAVRARGQN